MVLLPKRTVALVLNQSCTDDRIRGSCKIWLTHDSKSRRMFIIINSSFNPTVYIIDDDAIVRQSITQLVESIELQTRSFETIESFLTSIDSASMGCVVVDAQTPGIGGIELLEKHSPYQLALPIIILTSISNVSMAVMAIKMGAEHFLVKPYKGHELLEIIQSAVKHNMANQQTLARRHDILHRLEKLTPREREVMHLVVHGKANKQVATELGCSGKTVEVHRARVMDKMEAESLAHLVRMSILAEQANMPTYPYGKNCISNPVESRMVV